MSSFKNAFLALTSGLLLTLTSCSDGLKVESILKRKEPSLHELVNLMKESNERKIYINDQRHLNKEIWDLLSKTRLDCIEIQVSRSDNGFNSEDSIIIMTKYISGFFTYPEYIIYDFSESGRVLKDIDSPNAAFQRKRVKGKWYVAEQGFD